MIDSKSGGKTIARINVSKPFLPPAQEYHSYLDGIWSRDVLTNNGPLVRELEQRLGEYLGLPELLFLSNGTTALQFAIRALEISGEVITTPFTYVATISSLVWENCTPVFVDIDKASLNINPDLIEKSITPRTAAILATHVFGNPCNIDEIEKIAKRHKIKVIYDAAHCFATEYRGKSVLEYGDISCLSFHATKIFHTVEGGAVFAKSPELMKKIFHMRNFGHAGFHKYSGLGINGKNCEFHAAMGLCNLKYIDSIREKYRNLYTEYTGNIDFKKITIQSFTKDSDLNYSYYPVIFQSEQTCLEALEKLETHNISPRRYFYPSLNKLDYVVSRSMPVSEEISARILCLPLYFDLESSQVQAICQYINQVTRNTQL